MMLRRISFIFGKNKQSEPISAIFKRKYCFKKKKSFPIVLWMEQILLNISSLCESKIFKSFIDLALQKGQISFPIRKGSVVHPE